MKNKSISLVLLLVWLTGLLHSENAHIIVFRTGKAGMDKYFLRVSPNNYSTAYSDSLPPNHIYSFHAHTLGDYKVTCRIENYAGWPTSMAKIATIDNDTTYLQAEIKRDAFGNPFVKLKIVSKSDAMQAIQAAGANILYNEEATEDNNGSKRTSSSALRSGTGFLLSSKGYVVTNYHVIGDAKTITVKNLNGDKKLESTARIVLKDQQNDLVVLKLNDSTSVLDTVPFFIKNTQSDLGERVMVFGYPLINSMGYDIKLTTGIISSVNGYEDDANSYQISAPVQAGNSGGPVFDEKGNLLGIINAKHRNAENATYAVKASYLSNLLQNIPEYKGMNANSELWKLSVTEQAKVLQRLVFMVEVK